MGFISEALQLAKMCINDTSGLDIMGLIIYLVIFKNRLKYNPLEFNAQSLR